MMRKADFLKGLISGVALGLLLAGTVAYAANIGVFDRGHCQVYVYQNDSNPNIIYYDVSLKNNLRNNYKLTVDGAWATSVRVTAQPK